MFSIMIHNWLINFWEIFFCVVSRIRSTSSLQLFFFLSWKKVLNLWILFAHQCVLISTQNDVWLMNLIDKSIKSNGCRLSGILFACLMVKISLFARKKFWILSNLHLIFKKWCPFSRPPHYHDLLVWCVWFFVDSFFFF